MSWVSVGQVDVTSAVYAIKCLPSVSRVATIVDSAKYCIKDCIAYGAIRSLIASCQLLIVHPSRVSSSACTECSVVPITSLSRVIASKPVHHVFCLPGGVVNQHFCGCPCSLCIVDVRNTRSKH